MASNSVSVVGLGDGVDIAGVWGKVTTDDTNGAYCVFEVTFNPGGGAPTHIHHNEDEIMTVIEGIMTITADGRDHLASVGAVVRFPRGVAHAFRNNTNAPVRVIFTAIPGGLDNFFAALGTLGSDATPDQLEALNKRYGLEFLR